MTNGCNSATEAARSTDYVDDLFDYDVGLDGILQEINTNSSSTNALKQFSPQDNSGVVLGLDEEVRVAKKRQPVAKLDEHRLLTQAGIPKLRRSARKNLKLKGKGHEFSDLARLLNFYQLWLDDLFPRAKFADGLAIIERLGHSRSLQTMRRAWIDEEKLKPTDDETSGPVQTRLNDGNVASNTTTLAGNPQSIPHSTSRSHGRLDDVGEGLFIPEITADKRASNNGDVPPDDDFDELDALLREHRDESDVGRIASIEMAGSGHHSPYNDEFDEIDALLREHEDEPDIGNSTPEENKKIR
ncbi:replication fork protection component Swi3-domain-containing protein [Aspergillus aurantiobrunneus]